MSNARTGQKGVSRGAVTRPVARYRPGRLPEGADLAAEAALLDDSDDENEEQQQQQQQQPGTEDGISSFGAGGPAGSSTRRPAVKVQLSQVQIGKQTVPQGYDSDEYETDTDDEPAPSKPTFRKPGVGGPGPTTTAASKAKEEESSEYETDSEEEESEDEPAPLLKPVFVPKRLRGTVAVQQEKEEVDPKQAEAKAAKIAQMRKKESHLLAAETIKRELAEKEFEENLPDLSDTDGKDPEEEFQAWRLRELHRIKRSREIDAEREKEREEIERRRAMPEEQRLAEDLKRAQESRDAKSKGQQGFMQKYYHKGAFFQDMDILKKHDFTEATEGHVDVNNLPALMQVRDYGKRSRSKWTHLANEDTSKPQKDARFTGLSTAPSGTGAGGAGPGAGSSGSQACFVCGGPHLKRDCPQVGGPREGGSNPTTTGSNAGALGGRTGSSRWNPSSSRDREAAEEREYEGRSRGGATGRERRPTPPRRDVFDGPDRDFEKRRDDRIARKGHHGDDHVDGDRGRSGGGGRDGNSAASRPERRHQHPDERRREEDRGGRDGRDRDRDRDADRYRDRERDRDRDRRSRN
ncbi:hypothetical protein A4X09_0g1121 [Tilletia walkeri]|uniref:Micro-fibrillar-associated protein 1 C-terminal domain-containing protein n=1 Tax=Tilletia walkeri TaxID=117179 RepID=A0A8X7NCG6_9BASI|nr:hypothetical protein A4X09_0g1121 [Tilletia walkeri]